MNVVSICVYILMEKGTKRERGEMYGSSSTTTTKKIDSNIYTTYEKAKQAEQKKKSIKAPKKKKDKYGKEMTESEE